MKKNIFKGQNLFAFETGCLVENDIWFYMNAVNAICCYNTVDNSLDHIMKIQESLPENSRMFSDIQYFDGKLFLIPQASSAVYIYSIEKKTLEKINLREICRNNKDPYVDKLKFSYSVIVDNDIYMFPLRYPAIIKMNLNTYEMTYYDEWIKDILSYRNIDGAYFRCRPYVAEKKIYLSGFNADIILQIDTETDQCSLIRKKKTNNGYTAILKTESGFWLLDKAAEEILICNEEGDDVYSIKNWPAELCKIGNLRIFSEMIEFEDNVYLIPLHANMIISVSKKTMEMRCVQICDFDKYDPGKESMIHFILQNENSLWIFDAETGEIIQFDLQGFTRKAMKICITKGTEIIFAKSFFEKKNNFVVENGEINLEYLLTCLAEN